MADPYPITTFPEDPLCPVCPDRGGFVKSTKSVEEALDEQRKKAKKIALQENSKLGTSQVLDTKEKDITSQAELPEHSKYGLQTKPDVETKIDMFDLATKTGTRPLVSKYSISRYSLDEWRKHNDHILDSSAVAASNIVNYNIQSAFTAGFGNIDQAQQEDNKRLKQKAKSLFRWKIEVEKAYKEIAKEVELLEIDRQRIKGASRVLMLPESISKECIELRNNRAGSELVADIPEQELKKEMDLVNEVRAALKSTLQKIEEQLAIDKAAKHRIEYDWCDKTQAYNTETLNLSLNVNSNTIMFKPGAVKFGGDTAPLSSWEFFCRENIENVEAVRQASADLRGTFNALLISNGRKLRDQADKTDKALAEIVAHTSEMVTKLEERLRCLLRSIADVEQLILSLQDYIMKSDRAMKLAQTRLDNRNTGRPHGENVRDQPHLGLIQEVKVIHETVSSLRGQLKTAEDTRRNLMANRVELERNIAAKRKSLSIDRDRCGLIRSHYPSASELAGF